MVRTGFHAAAAASLLFLFSSSLYAQSGAPRHPPRPTLVGPAKWEPSSQDFCGLLDLGGGLEHRC